MTESYERISWLLEGLAEQLLKDADRSDEASLFPKSIYPHWAAIVFQEASDTVHQEWLKTDKFLIAAMEKMVGGETAQ